MGFSTVLTLLAALGLAYASEHRRPATEGEAEAG